MIETNGTRPFLAVDDERGFDATADLAAALISASGAMSEGGVAALTFLHFYSPEMAQVVKPLVLDLKVRQTAGTVKRLQDAISAVALKELWNRVNLAPGGGK